jgi:radical SAM superfamily enzyme YgiQ (UPF0313 family)
MTRHPARKRLLFLQLPRLDPDLSAPGENVMLAAACLTHALRRTPEARYWRVLDAADAQDNLADEPLLAHLENLRPDCIAATCTLWNVERTLRLLQRLKRQRPGLRLVVGGPEAAREHPLLFRADSPCDAVAIGEGETVFPSMLRSLRTGAAPDIETVATRRQAPESGGLPPGWLWGTRPRTLPALVDVLPPPTAPVNRPDAQGMAYLETNRGCPLRCAFCCYNLRRTGSSSLPPENIFQRIRILQRRGAREIRLVDPTFNAHPQFDAVVATLARANPDRKIAFFVEIRADTLADEQARQLAQAGVTEAEVGIQSTDPAVLKILHRGTNTARVLRGIGYLRRHGIRPTIDFMYGLPRQDRQDIDRSLQWLEQFPDAHPQFLPLLLLPGTELRDRAAQLQLKAQPLPPYRVLSTDTLSTRDLREIEKEAAERLGAFDAPTETFAGHRLPDLFPAQARCTAPFNLTDLPPATANRQALFLRGRDLFQQRSRLSAIVQQAIKAEPHILWQFVLEPIQEEPLDLLDELLTVLRRQPSHWLDRLVAPPGQRILAARRLFVRPVRGTRVSADWLDACDHQIATISH